jgi:UDP-glucuronate 4-epimerase
MTVLVTGAAGFIGFHLASTLLDRGERVVGLDNFIHFYDPALKQARAAELVKRDGFTFHEMDVADPKALESLFERHPGIDRVLHMAGQPGVRQSITHPWEFLHSNIDGQLAMVEAVRRLPDFKHLVFASSSSVYGDSKQVPFALDNPADRPRSLYAASKRAAEHIAATYSHLYGIPITALRFFTVYGPWGRPDMAAFLFIDAVLRGNKLWLFNGGDLKRDFTYIEDVIAGVLAAMDRPPVPDPEGLRYAVYNLGNHRTVDVRDFVKVIEAACGRKAKIEQAPMQPGDVHVTYADISASTRDLGYLPRTPIEEGIPRTVAWYKRHYGIG